MKRLRNLITSGTILFIALALLIVMPFACSKKKAETKEIKIGAVLPLTGVQADHGSDMKYALEMALTGHRHPVKLIYEDSQSTPNGAVNAVSKLINIDRVPIIIGPITSSEVLATAPICEKNAVVLISPTASNPKISDAGDYIFRTGPLASEQGIAAAKYALDKVYARKVAILYMQDDTGLAYRRSFKEFFEKNKGAIIYESGYPRDRADFRTELAKIKAVQPDVIYTPATSQSMGYIAKQKQELGITTPIIANFGIEGDALLTVAGSAAEGIVYTAISVSETFSKNFEAQFKKTPGIGAPLAYDVLSIILQLVEADCTTANDFKTGLYKISEFPGVCGKVSFDDKGDAHRDVVLKIVKDKAFIQIEGMFND